MLIVFKDKTLERSYNEDGYYPANIDRNIVDKGLRIIRWMANSDNIRVVLSHPACDPKPKSGKLKNQYGFRINKQRRLLFMLDEKTNPKSLVISYVGKHYE